MPQRNSAAGLPAGHWPTTRSTGRPNGAASAAPTPARSCGWSTTTATRSGPDQPGLLEVKPGQLGPSADWMRTTDMARIDEDGFLWILGRADQAIIRGGFKVMPDDVRAALESHPAVRGRGGGRPARRTPRGDTRRGGGAAGYRVRRRRRAGGVPAKPAGPLRDSHRDRDRRRDPPDTVRQARSERHPWQAEARHRRRGTATAGSTRGARTRCWCATPTASATPKPTAARPNSPAA